MPLEMKRGALFKKKIHGRMDTAGVEKGQKWAGKEIEKRKNLATGILTHLTKQYLVNNSFHSFIPD